VNSCAIKFVDALRGHNADYIEAHFEESEATGVSEGYSWAGSTGSNGSVTITGLAPGNYITRTIMEKSPSKKHTGH